MIQVDNGRIVNEMGAPLDPEKVCETFNDLLDALRRLRDCPDCNLDELEPETIAALDQADAVLAKVQPEFAIDENARLKDEIDKLRGLLIEMSNAPERMSSSWFIKEAKAALVEVQS